MITVPAPVVVPPPVTVVPSPVAPLAPTLSGVDKLKVMPTDVLFGRQQKTIVFELLMVGTVVVWLSFQEEKNRGTVGTKGQGNH